MHVYSALHQSSYESSSFFILHQAYYLLDTYELEQSKDTMSFIMSAVIVKGLSTFIDFLPGWMPMDIIEILLFSSPLSSPRGLSLRFGVLLYI